MWWIIGITLVICIFALMWLFTRGADMRNKNSYAQKVEDEEQEKAVASMNYN